MELVAKIKTKKRKFRAITAAQKQASQTTIKCPT